MRKSFVTPPILVESKNLFSKKHSFINGKQQFRNKYKIGAKEILTLVYLYDTSDYSLKVPGIRFLNSRTSLYKKKHSFGFIERFLQAWGMTVRDTL